MATDSADGERRGSVSRLVFVCVDTIEDLSEIDLTTQYQKAMLISDGVNTWLRYV
jgi:hypothetical protein